jgi:hypothetical protein
MKQIENGCASHGPNWTRLAKILQQHSKVNLSNSHLQGYMTSSLPKINLTNKIVSNINT